ncbi:peptide chain release factor 2 [Candidatus Azambacteria bacterium]|nr:peptide chain release factor 2 [Candidatus Azambacteria bacterium]
MIEIKEKIVDLKERLSEMRDRLDLAKIEEKISGLEKDTMHPNFWDDTARAKKITTELNSLKSERITLVGFSENLDALADEVEEIEKMENTEESEEFKKDLEKRLAEFERNFKKEEVRIIFSGKYDKNNAIISIYSGAGGLDAQDWASMLLRMYQRHAEKRGWEVSVFHHHTGEESGTAGLITKNVTFSVSGRFAYGYLKNEAGVHRLVRISPFSSQDLRHTSFAYVEVMPEIESLSDIEIKDEDLEVDTFRSSGPGGQNVNKRETAVRIKHIPTNIVVACQNERSQIANKERAMKLLASKLVEEMERQKKNEISELKGKKVEIEWGSQIRSYVLHPYKMVKDHRTETETSQTDKVLDGELDEFIESEIKQLNK